MGIKKAIVEGARKGNLYDALTSNYTNMSKDELVRVALEVIYNRYSLQNDELVSEDDKKKYNEQLAESLDEILY